MTAAPRGPAPSASLVLTLILVTAAAPALAADAPALETKSVLVTLSPPEVHFKAVEGKYDMITIPGADLLVKPGYPILPFVTVTLTLPPGVELESVNVSAEYEVLEGNYRIAPGPKPRPLGPPWLNDTRLNYRAEPDPTVYSSREFLPEENFTYSLHFGLDVETMRDAAILAVRLFPVRYSPALGEVRFAREMMVTVTYRVQRVPAQTYDRRLVIITSSTLLAAANDLAASKRDQGWGVLVVTTDEIDANYTGSDLQEEIRSFIADKKAEGYAFFLILGDADQVPARLAYIPDGYADNDESEDGSFVETDLYYADLDGTWDPNGNGRYGEVGEVDGVPDVIVGRLPASSLAEAQAMVSKVANYSPGASWFYRFLMIGTVTFDDDLHPEGEYLNDVIEYEDLPEQFRWVKLYDHLGNLSPSAVQAEINRGYGFVNFAGHGNPSGWYSGPLYGYRTVYSSTLAATLNNSESPAIVVAMACMTARFVDVDSIGEAFLTNPGGAVGYFGATRVAWGYEGFSIDDGLAGKMDRLLIQELISAVGSAKPWVGAAHASAIGGYVLTFGVADEYNWKTVAEYGTLLGDPTIELTPTGSPPPPTPGPKLFGRVMDSNGLPVAGATVSLYEYDANSLVAQTVTDPDGYFEIPLTSTPPMAASLRVSPTDSTLGGSRDTYLVRDQFRVDVSVFAAALPPNTVLIVVDDDGAGMYDGGVWPDEISQVAASLGFNAVVYRESEYGEPTLDTLLEAVAVFWHAGTYYGEAVSKTDANLLIEYVKRGGSLVVEGEDVAYDHGSDGLMREVLHASYQVDDAGPASLEVSVDHPLTLDLPSSSDFNVAPPFPDGVSPLPGGLEFLRYSGTAYSAAVAYDGIGGNGSRVVYFAFPLHYLNATHREILIRNSLLWTLGGDSNAPVVLSDHPHVLNGTIRVNLTAVHPLGISGARYGIDGDPVTPLQVVDGSADEAREDLFIEVDASSLEEGEHLLTILVKGASKNLRLSLRVHVTHLQEGWTIVSVAEPTRGGLTARDLGMAIGDACSVISRWDPAAKRYYSYLPGTSPGEYDFPVLRGYGYFVFLDSPATLAWVEGQEPVDKEGWS